MNNLFNEEENVYRPLAERMRPKTLDDFIGQEDVIGKDSALRHMINNDLISSMIFWGPPGVGKTTLAKIIANKTNSVFKQLSAVTSGVKEIKDIISEADFNKLNGKKTILFVDEIHRFNKAQQDAFLPFVENGDIILIGATTENPSFEVNSALLSRTKVYVLNSLTYENIISILKRAIIKENDVNEFVIEYDDESLEIIANMSNGDARSSLNTLENILNFIKINNGKKIINKKVIENVLSKKMFMYDKNGNEHYNIISALHKSMRNSDPDAALYYLARMLEAGEDPLYVARRLIRFASEDIGLANPNALVQANAAFEAARNNGMPECNVNLAQAVVYLSCCPKSNSLYEAYESVRKDAIKTAHIGVPIHLRNAVTKLDGELGFGDGYQYAHNEKNKITNMVCLPQELKDKKYYKPSMIGKEKAIKEELDRINKLKEEMNKK
ncbi:MAG: replication-associated recombination protein A [Bacilli bacterium]|nr:replication-associated recombination protein A [Bacilli bacterium]